MKFKHIFESDQDELLRFHGIVSLRDGLTLDKIEKDYGWLWLAKKQNAILGENSKGIVWYDGTWEKGKWYGSVWKGGTWKYGTWETGTWEKGTWEDGVWYSGDWKAGIWIAGEWINGTIRGVKSKYPPSNQKRGLIQLAKSSSPVKVNPILKTIENETILFVADYLLKTHKIGEKISMREIKKMANADTHFGAKFSMKIMKEFVTTHSSGFSVQDLIDYDSQKHENTPIKKTTKYSFMDLVRDKKLKLGMDFYVGRQQKIFARTNHVLQLNWDEGYRYLKKETLVRDGIVSVLNPRIFRFRTYVRRGNGHPVSSKSLTMAWCRYTIFPEKNLVVLDEIQTDHSHPMELGAEFMDGWEKVMMKAFIHHVRHTLKYRTILMPTYDTKINVYRADDPFMSLYKSLPSSFGFKKMKTPVKLDGKELEMFILESKRVDELKFGSIL